MVAIEPGTLVAQHPDTVVDYRLLARAWTVETVQIVSWRPVALRSVPTVTVRDYGAGWIVQVRTRPGVAGVPGARYRVSVNATEHWWLQVSWVVPGSDQAWLAPTEIWMADRPLARGTGRLVSVG